jgi:hypothetical protein
MAAVAAILALAAIAPTALGATSAPRKDALASAIEKRLNESGHMTIPMTASEGYFYRNPVLPSQAFYTDAGCGQGFRFVVNVYKTVAQADAMYSHFYRHVVNIGGSFQDFNMVRRGRVIYMAETARRPGTNAPPVPTKDFHSLVASDAHGCKPPL